MNHSRSVFVERLPRAAYAAFAVFGCFWGVWGASIPRIRDQAAITDGQLGTALLFVGVGALPAMLLTGKAIDRWGLRLAAAALCALGVSGLVVALTGNAFISLCVGLLLVGVASGATDVAMNTTAGQAEQVTARPIITRAHGVFSAFVVLSSLGTGLLAAAEFPTYTAFATVVFLAAAAAAYLVAALPRRAQATDAQHRQPALKLGKDTGATLAMSGILLVGLLGALAFAGENAHQSWSAVFFEDVLESGPGLSAVAPAVFAAVVAITRFSIAGLRPAHSQRIILTGAAAATFGAGVLAVAPSIPVAAAGLAIAAAGTAVLFPTLMGIVSREADESSRGRATSLLTTVSYLGFLLGPVYVGLWSQAVGLRGAMAAVAVLGAALFILTPPLLRLRSSQIAVPVSPGPAAPAPPATNFEDPSAR